MRKLIALTAALLVAGALATVAWAAGTDNPDAPPCADIVGGTGAYDEAAKTVNFRLTLLEPSCRNVVYAVFVYDEAGDRGVIGGQAKRGDGGVDENGDAVLEFLDIQLGGDPGEIVQVCAVSHRRGALDDRAGLSAEFACTNGIELTTGTPGGEIGWD